MAAIKYRTQRRRIKKNEWSLTDQFFPKDIVQLRDNTVFIDGGAYNGDTCAKLLRKAKEENKDKSIKIIAFEPGYQNMKILRNKYESDRRISLIQSGLSDKTCDLYFCERGSSSYLTSKEKSNCTVHVVAIDDLPECQGATWIKMDIEGAEWDALHGAKDTIVRNKPVLTICIYHSDKDMLRIAEWIHEMVPEYKLYVRQHTRRNHETVLYAIK